MTVLPDVFTVDIDSNIDLASDGVWDVLTNQDQGEVGTGAGRAHAERRPSAHLQRHPEVPGGRVGQDGFWSKTMWPPSR